MIAPHFDTLLADCVAFTQRLIQTPSLSGDEAAIAAMIEGELQNLNFDEAFQDGIGNVIGRVYGQDRSLPALVLNTHLDHVDPGDPQLWPADPYAAEIIDGHIVGRGAVDIKGPLAVQIFSLVGLLRHGERPLRDVLFTGVVDEERGGSGASFWAEHLDEPVALVLIGEPSNNQLALGHRSVFWVWVQFNGRSAHASVPHTAQNPNYSLAEFLRRLEAAQSQLRSHPHLGPTTVSPTIIEVDTRSSNVTPAWTRLFLDFRTAVESQASLVDFLQQLLEGLDAELLAGLPEVMPLDPTDKTVIVGFDTPPDHPLTQRVQQLLSLGAGRDLPLSSYSFATDGRLLTPYGLSVLGFAPGLESQAHTAGERISIQQMGEALQAHIALLKGF